MIKIMLVDPDEELRVQLEFGVLQYPDMELIAETDDEDIALQILSGVQVDVIILDLELRQGSGILFLKKMQALDGPKPFIVVATKIISKVIFDTIRPLGVDYIWTKQGGDYAAAMILEIIEVSKDQIVKNSGKTAEQVREKVNRGTQRRIMRKRAEERLEEMGFSYKYIGTKYLNEALLLVMLNPELEMNVTKALYPQIAKKFRCNLDGVEKNIRVTIGEVWSRRDESQLRKLYPYEWNKKTGRPTNLEFIRNVRRQLMR